MVSPLDLAFSQNVIYLRFTDGKSVDDAVWQIRHRKATDDENCDIVLQPPFPMIEILKWRPKLRDGDGKPLLDSQGGNKFGTERSFSLDNRRLYALQRAAIAHYPKKCHVAVLEITSHAKIIRHMRKFRTRTNGLSITITEWSGVGRDNARNFNAMRVWDWQTAVCCADEANHDEKVTADAANTGSCGSWEYLDPTGKRQGPFSNWQMGAWWRRNMLPPETMVRPYDAALANATAVGEEFQGAEFTPINKLFDGEEAFAPSFTPHAADLKANWQPCQQCWRDRQQGKSFNGKWYCATCWIDWESTRA